jgi:hypothetical protein
MLAAHPNGFPSIVFSLFVHVSLCTTSSLTMCRWFPTGKIVFVAPTKPLVDQQMQACFQIVGIPASHTHLMTGTSMAAAERRQAWADKTFFFCTPQVRSSGRFYGWLWSTSQGSST